MYFHDFIFTENRKVYWIDMMRKKLLKAEDVNVVIVDWERGAAFPFVQAFGNSRVIGDWCIFSRD